MKEDKDKRGEANPAAEGRTKLSHEGTVEHLKSGYENSQSVVRFLDTKAAAIIGGVPVLLGIVAALLNWLNSNLISDHFESTKNAGVIAIFFLVLSALLLILIASKAIYEAFSAVTPRNTGESEPSVIFPFNTPGFETRLETFTTKSAKECDVIEDYKRQIIRMGEIVEEKIKHTSNAIRFTRYLLIASASIVSVAILLSGYSTISASECCSMRCETKLNLRHQPATCNDNLIKPTE